jgi:NADP-dependent 3-hydroxy acid dehydrogenase YdfG
MAVNRPTLDVARMMSGMSHLQGKTMVITGAAGGFGRLVAEMSLECGANVVGLDVDGEAVARAFTELATDGRAAVGMRADVTDAAQVQQAVDAAVDRFGRVDVLVNNAGVMPNAFFADHDRALPAWDRCIDINLKGVLHGVCAVYDHMIRQGQGHIVNISSIYGNTGVAGAAVYGATKAAVVTLSNALRVETQGVIKVTVVRPSGVPGTGLSSTMVDPGSALPLTGHNVNRFLERIGKLQAGEQPAEERDPDHPAYWAISPHELATQIVHVIDQPLGVNISDITVRATGEDYVY